MNKRAKLKLAKARQHRRNQETKRAAALEAARASSDPRAVMEQHGYVPDGNGGYRTADTRRKQKKLP